jgi:hypothetical protein
MWIDAKNNTPSDCYDVLVYCKSENGDSYFCVGYYYCSMVCWKYSSHTITDPEDDLPEEVFIIKNPIYWSHLPAYPTEKDLSASVA